LRNGAGKSSVVATLMGDREPASGQARIGSSTVPACFRQDLSDLPLTLTMYDAIQAQPPLKSRGGVQNHLGAFGFSGEEVFREIRTLSGGERARTALAIMTLTGANLLVFNEPTNHLDVENIEVLEDAPGEYEGTRAHREQRPRGAARGGHAGVVVRRHASGGLRWPVCGVGGGSGATAVVTLLCAGSTCAVTGGMKASPVHQNDAPPPEWVRGLSC